MPSKKMGRQRARDIMMEQGGYMRAGIIIGYSRNVLNLKDANTAEVSLK